MTSHVVVVDTTARSAKIRTTPDKHLTEVLEEACAKLGRDPFKFGLKNNKKVVDLSLTIRLAGLSSGARLELIASSKSPSIVSVALQLPQPESDGTSRLTDKFSSDTTLWMVMRKFEAAEGRNRNFTGRGIPVLGGQTSGSGRLYFETPVLQVMGRELSSLTDFQKTLSQLGFTSGTALLRITFRSTETPLEEAMQLISQYFAEIAPPPPEAKAPISNGEPMDTTPDTHTQANVPGPISVVNATEVINTSQEPLNSDQQSLPPSTAKTASDSNSRPIAVFAPPQSSTPQAAQQTFNEKDYEPTIDHAKLHQQRLKTSSQNQRLPTDAELAAQASAQAQKSAQIREVKIKVRFPDQSQVEAPFSSSDTAQTLYQHVRDLMQNPHEPFSLTFSTAKGPKHIPLDDAGKVQLIRDLGMAGRVLVNFVWEAGVSAMARSEPLLKAEYRQQAKQIKVPEVEGVDVSTEVENHEPAKSKEVGSKDGKERKGMPKWLKLPGKK